MPGGWHCGANLQSGHHENTGHLEVIRVHFDSEKISFHEGAKRFFEIHDPTQADGQGPDIGQQYLSVVFYTSSRQKKTTEALIAQLVARDHDVVTKLRKAMRFWPAEDYHQDYYEKNGQSPYCHRLVRRFGDS